MAVQGKFLADFTSFYSAVQKADVQLRGLETGAGKVSTSLGKMVDSFSGRKLIQEATLVEEAVLRIGGASKLTDAEQAKVNRTITEALAKYKALGVEAPRSLQMMAEETKKVEQAMGPASKMTGQFLDHFKGMLAGMLSASAIIGGVKMAFSTLTDFIGSSIKSYAAAEAAQKKMTTALETAGRATPQVVGQFNALARQFQQTTVYSDELINEMQALLTQVGNVMPHQMEGALKAATNLASGLGIDLRQATMLVGKAFEGETGTLKRYGIVIDEAKLKAEGMPAVLDAIQSRFGGQAAAAVDTYAGRVQQLANAWDDVKEKVGATVAQDPVLRAALNATARSLDDTANSTGRMNVAWQVFLGALPQGIKNIKQFHDDLVPLAEAVNSVADAVARVNKLPKLTMDDMFFQRLPQFAGTGMTKEETAALNKLWDAQTKAAEAAKKHAEAARNLRDELSGAKLQGEVRKLHDAFKALTPEQLRTAETFDRVGKAAKKLYDEGATLTPELFRILLASQRLTPAVTGLTIELDKLGKSFKMFYDSGIPTIKMLDGVRAELRDLIAIQIPPEIQKAIERTKAWHDSLEDLSRSLAHLSSVSTGMFGLMVGGIGHIIASWNAATQAVARYKAQGGATAADKLSAISGGTAGVIGATGAGSTAGRVVGGAAAGASAGLAVGAAFAGPTLGVSLAIGAGVGALVGWIRGMSASAKAAKEAAENLAILKRQLIDVHGSMGQLETTANMVGLSFQAAWGLKGQAGLAEISRLTEELQRKQAKLNSAMEEYGFTWEDTGKQFKQLSISNQAQALLEQTRLLQGAGIEYNDILKQQASNYAKLIEAAIRTGSEIPPALKPVLEDLLEMGLLADGVFDKASWEQMEDAAKRFGIELSALGPTFQQQKLTATSTDIIKTFQMLINNGADFTGVLKGMTDEINTVVKDSLKFGTEIPANMQPWIQKLIDSGELLDENGKKITDISKLKFGEEIQVGLKDVVAKLQEMIDLMSKGIPGAVRRVGDELRDNASAWDRWRKHAADAAREVGGEVDAVSFGSSPGGLKEIPLMLAKATRAMTEFKQSTMHNLLDVERGVNKVGGPRGPFLPSGSGGFESPGERFGNNQHIINVTLEMDGEVVATRVVQAVQRNESGVRSHLVSALS